MFRLSPFSNLLTASFLTHRRSFFTVSDSQIQAATLCSYSRTSSGQIIINGLFSLLIFSCVLGGIVLFVRFESMGYHRMARSEI